MDNIRRSYSKVQGQVNTKKAEADALTEGRSTLEAKVAALEEERSEQQSRVWTLQFAHARLAEEDHTERELQSSVAQAAWEVMASLKGPKKELAAVHLVRRCEVGDVVVTLQWLGCTGPVVS